MTLSTGAAPVSAPDAAAMQASVSQTSAASPVTAGDVPLPSQDEVALELITLHARVLRRLPWVLALVALVVGWDNYHLVPTAKLVGWGIAVVAVECLRAWFSGRVLRGGAQINAARAHSTFVVLAAVAGLTVGTSALLFFPEIPIVNQVQLLIVYFGMASGGVAVSASSQLILAAYLLAMLIPVDAAWSIAHPAQAAVSVAASVLYFAFLIMIAGDGERLLARSIGIRQQRDRVVRDLERRNADVREAMAKAEHSAETRARVLAAASHDLRQPLHALSIYSAVLAENPSAETLQEVGNNIDQIVRSLGNMLGGLLDLSRLSAGYYVPDRQVFMLDALLADVCRESEGPAAAKGLTLVREMSAVRVGTDPTAITRIARNLIDNAIKYTDRGEIRIKVRRSGPSAVLEVIDTGKGIADSDQHRVFEEFYQVDNPGRDRSKGVGLGLAIVQRLVELIDATIELKSAPGQGTSFQVTLRNAVVNQVHGFEAPAAAGAIRLDGRRIYIVDDEIDIVKSMKVLLGQWGAGIETAQSGAATERLFERLGVPDLMIADLRLGEAEHGAALASRLRANFGEFPVLIITGETSSQALLNANQAGYPLLQKPINQETLRASISQLLI